MTTTAPARPVIPPTAPGASGWTQVCPLDQLEPLFAEAALVADEQVALVRLPSDEVLAVSHRDPYAGAHVMARGIVGSRDGRPTLASPLHKQVYDLRTGDCLTDDSLRLRTYSVLVRDGVVAVGAAV